jgi:leucyl/phenylalanyl-tRNA--protein transferase
MSRLPWLAENSPPESLPPADAASLEPNGLLAVGGSLEPDWLIHAYTHGAFPWYNPGEPILWWSPDPRAILKPRDLKISRSLQRSIRNRGYRVTADTDFASVISACAQPREGAAGTWITRQMKSAYCQLHAMGYAHSFEAWRDGELVGGLYGVAIGRVFFGESMFTRATDASKVAFAAAVAYLARRDFRLIDCQVESAHMTSLGATAIRRTEFVALLDKHCSDPDPTGSWSEDFGTHRHG